MPDLTAQQQQIHDQITADYFGGATEMVLSGYAGTGKTFLTGKLIDTFQKKGVFVGVCGPTHKSCKVLKKKMVGKRVPVDTAHRMFYTSPRDRMANLLRQYKIELDPKKKQKLKVELQAMRGKSDMDFENAEELHEDYQLIICDEASMIPEDMVDTARRLGVPVLYVGDGGQLPPVGRKPGVDLANGAHYTLTDIIRTADGSPIPIVADQIRHAKSPNKMMDILLNAQEDYPDTFVDQFLFPDPTDKDAEQSTQHLCWTNNTRNQVNNTLKPYPTLMDRGVPFMVHKGDGGTTIGDIITLISTPKQVDDDNPFLYIASFRDENRVSHTYEFSITDIHPDGYNDKFGVQAAEANYNSMKGRPRTVVAYPYCITTHKSQGSEWDFVNIHLDGILYSGMSLTDKRRWLYTAITRAKKKIFIST